MRTKEEIIALAQKMEMELVNEIVVRDEIIEQLKHEIQELREESNVRN